MALSLPCRKVGAPRKSFKRAGVWVLQGHPAAALVVCANENHHKTETQKKVCASFFYRQYLECVYKNVCYVRSGHDREGLIFFVFEGMFVEGPARAMRGVYKVA